MIYLDNSATTYYKPPAVINAVTNALTFLSANPGRGGHSMSMKGARLVQHTREAAAAFFNCSDPSRVVFTDNCTGALNLAILGSVKQGGHVVTTAYEHNSVLRPLQKLKDDGMIEVTVLRPNERGVVTADSIERHLKRNTYMVVTSHVSNVTGAVTDITSVGRLCRGRGLCYLVDGAQSAGYVPLDMKESGIDLLAVAPHKGLHAPQGVGLLLLSDRVSLTPVRFGGTGTASHRPGQPDTFPEGFETGTLPTPAISGLSAALGYTAAHALENTQKLTALSVQLFDGLKQNKKVTLYSPGDVHNGIAAFNVGNLTSEDVGNILAAQYDICVRAGLHCAPLIHRHYGTFGRGMVRVSVGCDNTPAQIDFLLNAIQEISG